MAHLYHLLRKLKRINHHRHIKVALFALLAMTMYLTMVSNVQPEKLDAPLFSQAKKDILSQVTIEDKEATIQKRQEALASVEDEYILKAEYAQNRVRMVSDLFDIMIKMNHETGHFSEDEKWRMLQENMPGDFKEQLTKQVFIPFLNATPQQLDTAKNTTITTVRQVMKQPIKVGEVQGKKTEVSQEINRVNLHPKLREAMVKIAQYSIIPNFVYDVKATELKRQEALSEVMPVMIRKGQVIVKEGQTIDKDIYRQLTLLGLFNKNTNPSTYIGLALFVALVSYIIYHFFQDVHSPVRSQTSYLLMYVLIFTIMIILMKILSLFQQFYTDIAYVVPVAMATMLIKMLINERMALITSMVFAFCGSIIFNSEILGNFNYNTGVYFFFSSLAGILFLGKQNHRSKILKSGLIVAIVNVVVVVMLVLLLQGQYSAKDVLFYGLLAIASGILSAVLTLGFMPFFEVVFGIVSTMKLIELANPNHPLLRKILTEAPGTYHHSIMVANLADAACEAIGADGFLARVAAYYHDLGKTKRPHFYIENQMNIDNPHDKISPQLSKTIITAHPYDGGRQLRKYKMPKELIDIAEEHHGTTLLKYFYHKAKQIDPLVSENDFRYPGPKARTKESAIVGIADSVEAAVRSLQNPTPQKIEALVRNIMKDRLEDGQFDECELTLKELDIAAKSFCETLKGTFHSRIEYPEIMNKKVKEA